jgi:hypothetical protein
MIPSRDENWEYRVIQSRWECGGFKYSIGEVSYSVDGVPTLVIPDLSPTGGTFQELSGTLEFMLEAFAKPVMELKYDEELQVNVLTEIEGTIYPGGRIWE